MGCKLLLVTKPSTMKKSNPTYAELEKQLSHSQSHQEKLKERVSFWRKKANDERAKLKSLTVQYERIIKEWRNMYTEVINNGWKILFVKIGHRIRIIKERF